MTYSIAQTIEDGIERIVYTPEPKRHQTPILMQHGMFHGAWCWKAWQELFAGWGWESIAVSLPGHGQSPVQRPIRWCTLGYYLQFLSAEIARLPQPPVLIGHSLGGALIQWHLKHVDELPAAVLVAPWTSHNMLGPVFRFFKLDPIGFLGCILSLTTTPIVRSTKRSARMFITASAIITAEELQANLGPESLWILLQYNPLLWRPAQSSATPMLWLAGAKDALIHERDQRRSAAHYGAEYVVVPNSGHNLMLEYSCRQTAEKIQDWLLWQGIV